jgi:hypothetical protein
LAFHWNRKRNQSPDYFGLWLCADSEESLGGKKKMGKNKLLSALRLLVVLVALLLGAGLCLAQSNGNGNATANGNSQLKQAGPPSGCKPGQMRCTTNKDRWAAAARHTNRRADQIRKNRGKVSK